MLVGMLAYRPIHYNVYHSEIFKQIICKSYNCFGYMDCRRSHNSYKNTKFCSTETILLGIFNKVTLVQRRYQEDLGITGSCTYTILVCDR